MYIYIYIYIYIYACFEGKGHGTLSRTSAFPLSFPSPPSASPLARLYARHMHAEMSCIGVMCVDYRKCVLITGKCEYPNTPPRLPPALTYSLNVSLTILPLFIFLSHPSFPCPFLAPSLGF